MSAKVGNRVILSRHDHLVRKHWDREGVVEESRTLAINVRDRGNLSPAQGPTEYYVRFSPAPADPRETKGLWLPTDMFSVKEGE